MKKSEERQYLDNMARQIADLVVTYRNRFHHDPVVVLEYVHSDYNSTPDLTEVKAVGATRESESINVSQVGGRNARS